MHYGLQMQTESKYYHAYLFAFTFFATDACSISASSRLSLWHYFNCTVHNFSVNIHVHRDIYIAVWYQNFASRDLVLEIVMLKFN